MGTEYNVDGSGNITIAGGLTSTSTTTGFLLPSLTTTQRNAIPSPATGLEIFNITTNEIEYYTGIAWAAVGNATGVTVNAGTVNHLAWYSSTSSIDSSNFLINNAAGSMTIPGTLTLGSGAALTITDSSTNTLTITAPTTITSYSLKWPTAQGGASTFLQNDGSGNLSWAPAGSGITGSGSTNSIPKFTSASVIGNSAITDNGITISSTSRLFSISYPGNALNPTSEYALKLVQGSTNLWTYLDFQNASTFSSATTIAIIGNSGNAGADVTVFGNGFSGNTRAFIDKVLVTCNGNTASASNYATTTVNNPTTPIARTYTATSSGGTITLTLQMSGNAAQYQVHIKVTAQFS